MKIWSLKLINKEIMTVDDNISNISMENDVSIIILLL
jgi:hypothetical protein